jgi:hypothetical protein
MSNLTRMPVAFLCTAFPVIRFSDAVKNAVRETVNQAPPDLFVGKRLEFREGGNESKGFVEFTEKFVAESDSHSSDGDLRHGRT